MEIKTVITLNNKQKVELKNILSEFIEGHDFSQFPDEIIVAKELLNELN